MALCFVTLSQQKVDIEFRMATKRINVAIPEDLHKQHSKIARLLDKDIQEATEEAVTEWNQANAKKAHRKAAALLTKD